MMRILHVTRDFPPRHCGGISTAVGGLVEALEGSDVSCAVASFDDYRPADAGGSGARRTAGPAVPRAERADVFRIDDDADLHALPRFARDVAPDLIQLHVDLLWDAATGLRDVLNVPLVTTLHVCHRRMLRVLGSEDPSASLVAQERALAGADLLVAPTHAAADAIRADYPEVTNRLHVAGFTVDPAPVASLAETRLAVVGRFGHAKGTDRLVALLPHLLADPALTIDVIGGLPRNPRRERRWFRRIAAAAGDRGDHVRVHGWLDPARRDEVLATARAFLSVSRIETFGLAALEALSMGIPVCGYGTPALVETGPGQTWLEEAEAERIAGTILELLADPARCRAMGRTGRDTIRPWPEVVDEWRDVYAAGLDVPKGGRNG